MAKSGAVVRLPILTEPAAPKRAPRTLELLERALSDQASLSAVERFAQHHEEASEPLQSRYYRDLLPASPPGPGQQYRFEVDLDACTGCKACVTACHSQNGLSPGESWRSVGLVVGGTTNEPYQQTITTACHHCLDPACLNGCPVAAYEKDEATGIVKHLDDQCIGCQYCVFTCPYEVPRFVADKGIVRKCDMCSGRLAAGEAPACVQACPNGAISIGVVARSTVEADAEGDAFLPAAPSPSLTLPTTDFRTKKAIPRNALPVDFHAVRPSHNHRPLVVMLVLTQLSVGAFAVEQIARFVRGSFLVDAATHTISALALGLLAIAASVAHLGRPERAWKAFLGLRTSWLSREILAFGAFAGVAAAYTALSFPGASAWASRVLSPEPLRTFVGAGVTAVGAFAVFCSAMLYHVTGKRLWRLASSVPRFFGTAAVLGLVTTMVTELLAAALGRADGARALAEARSLVPWLAVLVAGKLAFELAILRHRHDRRAVDDRRTAQLLAGPLADLTWLRVLAGALGGIVVPALVLTSSGRSNVVAMLIGLGFGSVLVLLGELVERTLFFTAVSAPRMPGGLSS